MTGAPENILKRRLAAGEYTRGCWLNLCSDTAAEVAASAGFDWVLVDAEHSPNEVTGTLAQLRAAAIHGCPAAVRVPGHDDWIAKRYLDIGAQTVMFPMVRSVAEAEACVAACLYPPEGRRGVGASLGRASGYSSFPDYPTTANGQICVVLQVETGAALDAAGDIAAVEGVDCVFIGPADLHADLGFLGTTREPSVLRRMEQAIGRIREAGAAAGMLEFDLAHEAQWRDAGVTMMAVGSDMTAMIQGLRATARP